MFRGQLARWIMLILVLSPVVASSAERQCAETFLQIKRFYGVRHQLIDQRIALQNIIRLAQPLGRTTKDTLGSELRPVSTFRDLALILETSDLQSTLTELQNQAPDFYKELIQRVYFIALVRRQHALFGERVNPLEANVLSHLLARQLLQLRSNSLFQPTLAFADDKVSVKEIRHITQEVLSADLFLDGRQTSASLQEELHTAKRIAQDLQIRINKLKQNLTDKKNLRQGTIGIYTQSERTLRGPWLHSHYYVTRGEGDMPLKDVLDSDIRSLEILLRELTAL